MGPTKCSRIGLLLSADLSPNSRMIRPKVASLCLVNFRILGTMFKNKLVELSNFHSSTQWSGDLFSNLHCDHIGVALRALHARLTLLKR